MREVTNFRNRFKPILKKNPSLNNYLVAKYSDLYQDAIATMSFDFDIPNNGLIEIKLLNQGDRNGKWSKIKTFITLFILVSTKNHAIWF